MALVILMLVVRELPEQTQFLHQLRQLEAAVVVLHLTVELIQAQQVVQAVVLTMLVMLVLVQLVKVLLVVLVERQVELPNHILVVAVALVMLEEMLVRLQPKVEQVVWA